MKLMCMKQVMSEHIGQYAHGEDRRICLQNSRQAGLEFNEYITHTGRTLRIDLPGNKVEYLEVKGFGYL